MRFRHIRSAQCLLDSSRRRDERVGVIHTTRERIMKRGMQQLIGTGLAFAACNATAGTFVERQHERVVEGRYIVAYEDQDVEIADMISQRLVDASRANGFRVEQTWKDAVYGAVISGLDDEKARQIAKMPGIDFVKNDTYMTLDAVQLSPPSWGLDRIDQRALPLSNSYTYNYQGTGVSIYVFDTAIEGSNAEFDSAFGMIGGTISRYSSVYDGYTGPPCTFVPAHGTNVAAIAAGRTFGVAKNVFVKGVRVTDCSSLPIESAIISGLNWVAVNGVQPAVINISIGINPIDPATSLLDDALLGAYDAGYFIVKSAGNASNDACAYQPTPALMNALYTVGGTDVNDNFWIGTFSSGSGRGPCVDILAPAVGVQSVSGTSTSPVSVTGTSFAAPHVSGAAALIYSEFPSYTPAQVATLLNARATTGAIGLVPSGTVNRLLYTLP